MIRSGDYGSRGILGIGTPQANPTVEAELQLLRPPGVALVTARLYCDEPDAERRIGAYLDELGTTLRRFDDLGLNAFGFACTGSTYLRGHARERALVGALAERFGYPVLTAAAAIESRLQSLGARRIALVAPYPQWLLDRGVAYWQQRGFHVAPVGQVQLRGANVHRIYELTTAEVLEVLRHLDLLEADVILFSGTGMPSLRAILAAADESGLPVLSSNLCLAGGLFDLLGMDGTALTAPASWRERLATA